MVIELLRDQPAPATHNITTAQFRAMPIELMERAQFGRIAPEFYNISGYMAEVLYEYEVNTANNGIDSIGEIMKRWTQHHRVPANLPINIQDQMALDIKDGLNANGVEAIAGGPYVLCSANDCHKDGKATTSRADEIAA